MRRLHDVGRSGWWLVGGLLFSVVMEAAFIVQLMAAARSRAVPQYIEAVAHGQHPMLIGGLVALTALSVTLFVFSVLPGTVGDNRYGGDPLERDKTRNLRGRLVGERR